MSEAKDRIDVGLYHWDDKEVSRRTIFVRKEQLEGQSLDRLLQDYIQQGWYILVRQVKQHPGVFGLTFCKNPQYHYGPNPNFMAP